MRTKDACGFLQHFQHSQRLAVCVHLCRYRMDYMQFVDYHRTSGADITIGCIAYDERRASDFGLMKVRCGTCGVPFW